jgi:hypothetical protein
MVPSPPWPPCSAVSNRAQDAPLPADPLIRLPERRIPGIVPAKACRTWSGRGAWTLPSGRDLQTVRPALGRGARTGEFPVESKGGDEL